MAEAHLHFDMGSGDTWQWSLLKGDMWGDGAARPWSSPVSQYHRPLEGALGHCWASPGAALGSLLHPITFPFGSWALVQSSTWGAASGNGLYWEAVAAWQGEGLGYSVGLVLSQCILLRHLTGAACTHRQCACPACPMHRCVHLGHCRHPVTQRASLLNTKADFCTEMQSSDCALPLVLQCFCR